MEEPSPTSTAGAPARASSRKRKSPVKFEDEPGQDPATNKRPRKGASSSVKKRPPKAPKREKAPRAPRKKPTKAPPRKKEEPAEDEVCAEEPDEEELALGEDDELADLGEQQEGVQEPAKRRVAQPTKARNVAAGDTEPEFVGEPIPDDDARTNWPKRYQQRAKTSRQDDDEDVKARRHYSSAKVDGEIYSLGDDVYVMAGEKEADYIGRITELFEGIDMYKYFTCRWFFRPEDTVISRAKFVDDHRHDPKRVFLSEDKNDNPLDCIISKVKIIHVDPNDGMNQLMGKVRDWNLYGTKLNKFDGSVLAANEDGGRCEDDATALREDRGDDPKDGSSGPESSEDSDDWYDGHRVVQVLAISANFPICAINGYDQLRGQCIYAHSEGEVQEDGMVDLVPIGPSEILMAYDNIGLEIFYYTTAGDEGDVVSVDEGGLRPLGPRILVQWDVGDGDDIEEYTKTICAGPGRKLEFTYLLIPVAVQTNVEVRLKLKDLGCRAVYGKIMANAIDYGNKSIHLFSCDRGRRLSFPSGTTSVLPLCLSKIALPCSRLLKFHIEVGLTVITTCDSHEEEKNLKFSLEFTRGITSQEREVDDDQVEVKIKYYSDY